MRGNAFLAHKNGKVYVICADALDEGEILRQQDCRSLPSDEGKALEQSLPFPVPSYLFCPAHQHNTRSVGLGDVVSWLTRQARTQVPFLSATEAMAQ